MVRLSVLTFALRIDTLTRRWTTGARAFLIPCAALLAFCVYGTPLGVSALGMPPEEPSEEMKFLQEETVSIASRYEQPISEAPSNVYVITDEDIRQSGASDLPTVLRRIPGLEVIQMTGADFNVSVRGDNQPAANKLLVMVDGRSIYVDAQGFMFWKAIPVTLPEIKRIEVLKGPASAVYGFNAFDGIINIITKSAEEMKGTTVQIGGGEFGTWTNSAIHAGTHGKLGYRLSYGQDQTQQWGNRDALAFRSNKFNIQTEYALTGDSRLLVSGGLVDVNRYDGPIAETIVNATKFSQGNAYVRYERPNFFVRAFWNRWNASALTQINPLIPPFLRITSRDGNPTQSPSTDSYNIESQHTVALGPTNNLSYGANYRLNTISGNNIDQFSSENRLGFFMQDEWRATQVLTLVAGARYDLDTFIHPTISPRGSILFKPLKDHTFRATVSLAYRTPTLFETQVDQRTFTNAPLPPQTIFVQGSNNLKPEEIVSYEVGYQGWFFQHRIRIRTDLFFNHISDLISARTVSPMMATLVNASGTADIYGGEAGIEFLATAWLTGFANYAYEQIGQSFTDTSRRGAPRSKVNLGLRGDWETGWNVETSFHYVGAATYPIANTFTDVAPFLSGAVIPNTRVPSYNLLNLRLGYRFWHEKAEVAVSAFNALNDLHMEHPLGDTIGSRVMGWLTLRL
jgi:iron complex outermembrane recepter protein